MYMTAFKDLESVRKNLEEIEGMCKEAEEVQALLTRLGEIKCACIMALSLPDPRHQTKFLSHFSPRLGHQRRFRLVL